MVSWINRVVCIRIVAAIGMGVVMFLIASGVAWINLGSAFHNNSMLQLWTRVDIMGIHEAIGEYVQQNNRLPYTLDELRIPARKSRPAEGHNFVRKRGKLVDGWGRPLFYEINGTEYTVFSYGRDGKPGGIGFDTDLSQKNPWPKEATQQGAFEDKLPSFTQFFFELPTGGILATCQVCGVLVGVLSFFLIRPNRLDARNWWKLFVKLSVTLGASVFLSMVMGALHIPSGH